jgi:hypothetical protein
MKLCITNLTYLTAVLSGVGNGSVLGERATEDQPRLHSLHILALARALAPLGRPPARRTGLHLGVTIQQTLFIFIPFLNFNFQDNCGFYLIWGGGELAVFVKFSQV